MGLWRQNSLAYNVKEIFYTLQGEGLKTGRPAVFLRFTGCNLWTGREEDRSKGLGGCSLWCDTNFRGTDGPLGGVYETPLELAKRVDSLWPQGGENRLVVCTGGEPLLQLDAPLTKALQDLGFEVAIESNGTLPVPEGVDWVCISPKAGAPLVVHRGDELKLVYPQTGLPPEGFEQLAFQSFLLQPLDGPESSENTLAALRYCLAHPRWRLSLQTHKTLQIP